MDCRKSGGFTLIELFIVMAIAAILFTQAIPGFLNLLRSANLATNHNQFIATINLARSEAIKRNKLVYICARMEMSCSEENDWATGWLVFVDDNRNAIADYDEIITVVDPLPEEYSFQSNANQHTLMFLGDGRARRPNGALPMMTFSICAPDVTSTTMESRAMELVINAAGRIRSQKGRNGETRC